MRWRSALSLSPSCSRPARGPRQRQEQDLYDERAERVRRLEILQRAESEFDPVPFDAEAARIYGRVTAAVIAAGRKPPRRTADLMIAATAIAEDLPLFTANPADFAGLDALLRIIPVARGRGEEPSSGTTPSRLTPSGVEDSPGTRSNGDLTVNGTLTGQVMTSGRPFTRRRVPQGGGRAEG